MKKLFAFVCGLITILGMHSLVDRNVQAQGDEAIDVCVNGEGLMRLADGQCPAGQRTVRVKAPVVERTCEKEQQGNIAGLRKRIADLEADAVGDSNNTAVAPFEVVNDRDTVVFSVEESADASLPALTTIFDDAGARIARIVARTSGGEVTMSSAQSRGDESKTSGVEATLSASGVDYADFIVNANSSLRLQIGRRREVGNYGLTMFNAGGKEVAGFGSTLAGSGIARISDALGNVRISIRCESAMGAGVVQIINGANLPVATFSGSGAAQSGFLQLTNNTGEPMVNAEVFRTGVGAVRAGPGAFQHGLMFIPLPASYIEGKRQ